MRKIVARALATGLLLAGAIPATAGVSVGMDLEALNEVLPALSARQIDVPISEGQSVAMLLEQLEVTGFDPAAAEGTAGHILTSMRVRIPQFGVDLPVHPRISLHVVRREERSSLELRFEEVRVPLLVGAIDVAPFLPPLSFPAEDIWRVEGAEGDVRVRSRLVSVEMGQKVVRFEFDLETLPSP